MSEENGKKSLAAMKPKGKPNGELIDDLPKKDTEKYSCGCPVITQKEVDAGKSAPLWQMRFPIPGGGKIQITQCTQCLKNLGGGVIEPNPPMLQEPNIILGH